MPKIARKKICGDTCTVVSYNGKLRFWMLVSFSTAPGIELPANMRVEKFHDGSCGIEMQCLVPETFTDDDCERKMDELESMIRSAVGEDLTSTSAAWNLGHSDSKLDYLMSAEEQTIVKEAMQNAESALPG